LADVFISYAKADRPLALKLAAMLEAEGWKTWWDTSLIPGDDFRNEIMTELGRARAVIVIWTDASIKSDWVRSEAGRAQAERKLIPVKLPHLSYKDLPPPFDVLHTEDVGQGDKIKAAVIAQLAKPAVEPSAVALLTKGFKYELLTWAGIVGGALTLFTNLGAVLKLADWARVFVQHWKEWTHAFWVWAFGWLGIHITPYWAPILSFLLFWSLLTLGQAFPSRMVKKHPVIDKYQGKSLQLTWGLIPMFFFMVIAQMWWLVAIDKVKQPDLWKFLERGILFFLFVVMLLFLPSLLSMVIIFARHKLHATITIVLMAIFCTIIAVDQIEAVKKAAVVGIDKAGEFELAEVTAIVMMYLLPVILLSVAPARAVSRRLIFLALGLLLLIGLNELSKLVQYWGVKL
jgi:hypothetical protein